MNLPAYTTPDALAKHLGWSPRRVRSLARGLGVGRALGNRMVLLPQDVVILLKASHVDTTVDDIKSWLTADQHEMLAEQEAQDSAAPTGSVYFLGQGDRVKIGFTTNMAKRMANFRSATTEPFIILLILPAVPSLEQYFHRKFADRRIVREWFKLDGEIAEFIARRVNTLRGLS